MSILLQTDLAQTATETIAGEEATEITLSFLELAFKGGWVMIPILFLSILTIYIFSERYFAINKASKMDINFMNRIKSVLNLSHRIIYISMDN